jgi:hypothetical protein
MVLAKSTITNKLRKIFFKGEDGEKGRWKSDHRDQEKRGKLSMGNI